MHSLSRVYLLHTRMCPSSTPRLHRVDLPLPAPTTLVLFLYLHTLILINSVFFYAVTSRRPSAACPRRRSWCSSRRLGRIRRLGKCLSCRPVPSHLSMRIRYGGGIHGPRIALLRVRRRTRCSPRWSVRTHSCATASSSSTHGDRRRKPEYTSRYCCCLCWLGASSARASPIA